MRKSYSILYIILISIGVQFTAQAQSAKLAQQYYQNGEFEKAASIYKKLYSENKNGSQYFDRYINCLIELEDYSTSTATIEQELKERPKNVSLYVTLGNVYERQFMEEKAVENYRKGIERLPAEKYMITRLANSFISLTKYNLAIETYEKGTELLDDQRIFSYYLGDLYRKKGESEQMITHYLNSLEDNPQRINSLKSIFQRYLNPEDRMELQAQLYEKIQEYPESIHFPELLIWAFIQEKDYTNALRQVKALDRKLNENGSRIIKLATQAYNAKDYDASIAAYNYIIEDKGVKSTYYLRAKRDLLKSKRKQITDKLDFAQEDIVLLEMEYESFLEEFGKSATTAEIIAELADTEAFYLGNLDKAISLLDEMIKYPGVKKHVRAKGKLSLGDFYLMKGEIWEATLLYSQVDKDFPDDLLGEEARFKNAKLSYYNADFDWAQAQFKVLKASTSKFIANDALDLAIFIMDNMGLDTSATALAEYSKADLLIFQNEFDEAFDKLDGLISDFPEHSLQDDVLYAKANVFYKKKDYIKAAELYQKIVDDYKEEIRADNALFKLAEINEYHLGDTEKAKQLYESLFIDFSNSTFAVEARKRYRVLRGDQI